MNQPNAGPSQWHNSLWTETAPARETNPPLEGDTQADVAVIGAGYTGLRAALELAKSGASVMVLEAQDVGFGASGRNGGQVNPMLPFNSPEKLRELVGDTYFERLTEVSLNSADELFEVIRDNQILCQARQNGWLRVLHGKSAKRKAVADATEWNRFGAGMEVVEGDALSRMSGTSAYSSGILTPRGGAVQPFMLAQGLAQAGLRHGVKIHGQSAVTDLARADGKWRVETGRGSVRCDWVVVATNGYTDRLVSGLAHSIIPLTPIQIATEPLAEDVIASVLPNGQTISDSRRVIMYARREPDNRIVFGGLGRSDRDGNLSGFDWVRKDAVRVFPQLKEVRWSHRWGGRIAITEDHLPHLHEPRPGLLVGLGYNGRGVAMSNVMGRVMAERAGGASPTSLQLPTTDIRPFRLRWLKMTGLGSAIAVMRFLDWLESR